MHAGRSHRDQHVAVSDQLRAELPIGIDHAGSGPGNVVIVGRHHARVFRRLATDQRTAGLHTTLRDAGHDGGDLLGHHLAGRDVVGHEQRFGADHHQIVDHHGHQIDANRVMPIQCLGDGQLGADTVGGSGQHRLRIFGQVELEQPSETAQAAEYLGPAGSLDRGLHQFDRTVTGLDVDPGRGVGHGVAGRLRHRTHRAQRASTDGSSNASLSLTAFSMPSSTCLPTTCGSGMGYLPSKQARHSRVFGCSVAPTNPSREI